MQKLLKDQSEICGDSEETARYGLMSADDPLYKQMERLEHEAPERERNPDFKNVPPLPGQMHQSMSLQADVKHIVYDAGMDSLAPAAGLSPGLVEVFRSKKEFKTNLNLFSEIAVVWAMRVLDVLFDEGDVSENDGDLLRARVQTTSVFQQSATPLEESMDNLKKLVQNFHKVCPEMSSNAKVTSVKPFF